MIGLTLASCWYGMMLVHELGHVLHGVLGGAEVRRLVWRPDAFSRTDFGRNPSPEFVVWGGFVWGMLIPLALLGVARLVRMPHLFLLRFFAGFCLVVNGAYLGAGAVVPAGDTEELLRLGTPAWVLAVVGIPVAAAGLLMWNGLGRCFGLGGEAVPRGALGVVIGAAAALGAGMAVVNLV